MNPLDLPGPAFLKFYVVFAVVVLAVARWLRSRLQHVDPPRSATGRFAEGQYPKESEAFHIAYLRGGARELGHTTRVLTATQATAESAATLSAPYSNQIEQVLEREGMIFKGASQRPFFQLTLVTILVLLGMAGTKIVVALSRGRTNIGFLLLLTVVFGLGAMVLLRPPRITGAAQKYLAWLNRAHDGLLSLVNQGRRATPGEVALVTAIYGLGPIMTEPVIQLKSKLIAEAVAKVRASDGGSTTMASSCSSSSSCGGGCGGGGCGGCGS
ncbi:MAG: TIGR04222 domain-containing membrane protein [Gemmatimonadota bacterium]